MQVKQLYILIDQKPALLSLTSNYKTQTPRINGMQKSVMENVIITEPYDV